MSSTRRQFLHQGAALVAGVSVTHNLAAQAGPGTPGREEDAIRELLAAYGEPRDRGSFETEARFYAPNADFDSTAGSYAEGPQQIVKASAPPQRMTGLTLIVTRVRFVRPDVAVADAAYRSLTPHAGERRTTARAVFVMSRHDGQWLIASSRIFRTPSTDA